MSRSLFFVAMLAALVPTMSAEAEPTLQVQLAENNSAKNIYDEIVDRENAPPTVDIRIVEKNTEIVAIPVRVGWLSSIVFQSEDGSPCGYFDAKAGSSSLQLSFPLSGVLHVEPQLSGITSNVNVMFSGGTVRTLVLTVQPEKVDAWTRVVLDCPKD